MVVIRATGEIDVLVDREGGGSPPSLLAMGLYLSLGNEDWQRKLYERVKALYIKKELYEWQK